ncbi:MAG TPA: hypothetical protein VNL18_04330 [Gemmatimonadales bacterium]|nr:hypothetical protein [Gemmatimonadales bacterium]
MAPEVFAGAGLGVARWSAFRAGVGASALVGTRTGDPAFRGELWAGYHLNPGRSRGPAFYGGVGAAVEVIAAGVGSPNDDVAAYLLAFIGLDGRPAARSAWFVEVGAGGGARVAVGYRVGRLRRA